MTQGANMFITGPQVIKAVTGEEVSAEELGGAATHNRVSGVAHFMATNEDECFEQVRSLIAYLPNNNLETPARIETNDPVTRIDMSLRNVVPTESNKAYDMRCYYACGR